MLDMDCLPDVLCKQIAALSDSAARRALSGASKAWREIVEESHNHDDPAAVNGSLWSYRTWEREGSGIPRRHVSSIDLTRLPPPGITTNGMCNELRSCLSWNRRPLTVLVDSTSEPFLDDLGRAFDGHQVCLLVSIDPGLDMSKLPSSLLAASQIHCCVEGLLSCAPTGLRRLVLHDLVPGRQNDTKPSQALQKALCMSGLESLTLYGLLTTDILASMSMHWPVSDSIETLLLQYESICDWTLAKSLQRLCPNVKRFALRASNLVLRDLEAFQWSLWPRLHELDLEHNYTLTALPIGCKSVTRLWAAHTGLDAHALIAFVGAHTIGLSASLTPLDALKLFAATEARPHDLRVVFTGLVSSGAGFADYKQLLAHLNKPLRLQKLKLAFREFFLKSEMLRVAQQALPCTWVSMLDAHELAM